VKDLTEYARKVSETTDLASAREAMVVLIENFEHRKKVWLFKELARYSQHKDLKRLHKWAWDLVLVGDGLKVL
jgi:hypothetical protein